METKSIISKEPLYQLPPTNPSMYAAALYGQALIFFIFATDLFAETGIDLALPIVDGIIGLILLFRVRYGRLLAIVLGLSAVAAVGDLMYIGPMLIKYAGLSYLPAFAFKEFGLKLTNRMRILPVVGLAVLILTIRMVAPIDAIFGPIDVVTAGIDGTVIKEDFEMIDGVEMDFSTSYEVTMPLFVLAADSILMQVSGIALIVFRRNWLGGVLAVIGIVAIELGGKMLVGAAITVNEILWYWIPIYFVTIPVYGIFNLHDSPAQHTHRENAVVQS